MVSSAPNGLQLTEGYACRLCRLTFRSQAEAIEHCRYSAAHTGAWCECCHWLFTSPEAFKSHVQRSSKHNICHACKLDFPQAKELRQHNDDVHSGDFVQSTHTGAQPVQNTALQATDSLCQLDKSCSMCNVDFATVLKLRKHQIEYHHLCSLCDRRFRSLKEFRDHAQAKHIICEVCYQHFTAKKNLRRHKEMVHLLCRACSLQFETKMALRLHKQTDHLICNGFGDNFDTKVDLQQHERRSHHMCQLCCQDFQTAEKLCLHNEAEHTVGNGSTDPQEKQQCFTEEQEKNGPQKTLAAISRLEINKVAHQDTPSNGRECFKCQQRLQSPAVLRQHKEAVHNICSFCGLALPNLDWLRDHKERAHSICRLCLWQCKNQDDLELHKENDHYICKVCGDRLKDKASVQKHTVYHNPKNLDCFGCLSLKFPNLSTMMQHLEYGNCTSKTNLAEINEWASEGVWSRDYQHGRLENMRYYCPTCKTEFALLSELLFHVEGNQCAQKIEGSLLKMMNRLEQKLQSWEWNMDRLNTSMMKHTI